MSDSIYIASTAEDFEAYAGLVAEYVDWCRARYEDDAWFVDRVFGYQALEDEVKELAVRYAPPRGKTFLASRDGMVTGGGAYRLLDEGTCELKRLYVPKRFHGQGIGRRLCNAIIDSAREDGFSLIKLDTGKRLREAIAMYRSIGFTDCAPYHVYPEEFLPYMAFMEMPLNGHQP